jgi:hypothetical protein
MNRAFIQASCGRSCKEQCPRLPVLWWWVKVNALCSPYHLSCLHRAFFLSLLYMAPILSCSRLSPRYSKSKIMVDISWLGDGWTKFLMTLRRPWRDKKRAEPAEHKSSGIIANGRRVV